jgi:hypothetical protein
VFAFRLRPSRGVVTGALAVGVAITISSAAIVRAEHESPDRRVHHCSSGTACVEGDSSGTTTWGVYGVSIGADGVHGVTSSINGNSAVAGIAIGTSGHGQGVFGRSSNGDGVSGRSSKNDGVYGQTAASDNISPPVAGVVGSSSSTAAGVFGISANGDGVDAFSHEKTGFHALYVEGDDKDTDIFAGVNRVNLASCGIDSHANLTCTGKIGALALRERHRNSGGENVLTYASQSATATIEDVGTARMYGGAANVRIDPAFASLTDGKWYYVFLTPLADTRGLYVSVKTPTAFQVRETEHGRSSLTFDYRIVAHPRDADGDRLPAAPQLPMPARPAQPGQ